MDFLFFPPRIGGLAGDATQFSKVGCAFLYEMDAASVRNIKGQQFPRIVEPTRVPRVTG